MPKGFKGFQKGSANRLGVKHTPETIEKMSGAKGSINP